MLVLAFSEPDDLVMIHIVYRIAAAYTRSQRDSRSSILSQEVFLLWEQAVSRYVSLHSSRLPFKAQFGSVDILAGQEDVQAHFGSFQASTKLCLYWGLL